jgi:23S rRNA (uracil1939-C5)-methyltransferase
MKEAASRTLVMEKAVYGGDCLAHSEGKAVLAPLTLPGETVLAHVVEMKRNFAKAEVDAVIASSADRILPLCPYFGACGGCSYQHATYAAQLALKRQVLREILTRGGVELGVEIEQLAAEPWEYRNRIRLALTSEESGEVRLNYRGRRSHDMIAVEKCPIAAPVLMDMARRVAAWLEVNDRAIEVAELELFTNHDQSQVLLTLFSESNGAVPGRDLEAWITALQAALPAEVVGIQLQLSDGSLTPQILAVSGSDFLTYRAAGVEYQVDHGAFFQVNRRLVDGFVGMTLRDVAAGRSAWDLYAGVGLFARQLTATFNEVVAVESAPVSLAALERNLAGTSGRAVAATTIDYLRRNREERQPRPDLIVLDPPRAGLGDDVTLLLNAIQAPALICVSCDPATLGRDLAALTRERYEIESITQVDMFPQTFHLETVVRLRLW